MSNYWLLAAERKIENPKYLVLVDALRAHPCKEVQAIGSLLSSVSVETGLRTIYFLNEILKKHESQLSKIFHESFPLFSHE